jgi:DHA2 family multidrug resistance protein
MSSVVSARRSGPADQPAHDHVSIMLATLIQTLDSTIANVALPHMQGTLSASQDEITWVLTSYIVAAAIATPLTGWLSDQLGVKRCWLSRLADLPWPRRCAAWRTP